MDPNKDKARLSGGELPEELRAQYLRVRGLILAEEDVHEVLGLTKLKDEDRWLYLIKTPFATWPKFVIGSTDTANTTPELYFRCGTEWAAKDEWMKISGMAETEELP